MFTRGQEKGWMGGDGYCLMFTKSVWEDEGGFELDSSDGHATLWEQLMPLNCTLKSGYY